MATGPAANVSSQVPFKLEESSSETLLYAPSIAVFAPSHHEMQTIAPALGIKTAMGDVLDDLIRRLHLTVSWALSVVHSKFKDAAKRKCIIMADSGIRPWSTDIAHHPPHVDSCVV